MIIREYEETDCKYLTELFYDTVHSVNAKDYTEEQLNAWATGSVNLKEWNKSLLEHFTVVAVEDNIIVGFGDIDKMGYLDRLYVHKDYQNRGIATAICNELEHAANKVTITTYASITAKSFFEKRGYKVIKEQHVERKGVLLTNYLMEK
ncbi:MAG: GNAT family N-acetyltransferase [Zhenhengia sp.]|uniref:GNAT family N-acetyltransferase n=1 Tax=Zhenhengia yiwuensis TaxID=2763666 RepID=A0A926EKK6_9FIRM|nr:GNAT family N-acetyltransferase [Zhenhengia yiwuensis]MBC8580200.1 GNAT family N-acetyltransferase [Zhenhengia yiwuensis]MBS5799887.1 GNAT family N-acetyltransferase [Clostridiales bacterium]